MHDPFRESKVGFGGVQVTETILGQRQSKRRERWEFHVPPQKAYCYGNWCCSVIRNMASANADASGVHASGGTHLVSSPRLRTKLSPHTSHLNTSRRIRTWIRSPGKKMKRNTVWKIVWYEYKGRKPRGTKHRTVSGSAGEVLWTGILQLCGRKPVVCALIVVELSPLHFSNSSCATTQLFPQPKKGLRKNFVQIQVEKLDIFC